MTASTLPAVMSARSSFSAGCSIVPPEYPASSYAVGSATQPFSGNRDTYFSAASR
jgi:hypothetical protein